MLKIKVLALAVMGLLTLGLCQATSAYASHTGCTGSSVTKNGEACITVHGTGLHVDYYSSHYSEGWFTGKGCVLMHVQAIPAQYPYPVQKQYCGTTNGDFDSGKQYIDRDFANGAKMCIYWTWTLDADGSSGHSPSACATIHS